MRELETFRAKCRVSVYLVKKFTRKGSRVVLKAQNLKVGDVGLEVDAEYSDKYRAIAKFKGVIS